MNEALGLIETVGLAAAIEAADTAVKAANVKLLGYEKTRGNGMIMVKIVGDVGAVKAAVAAGVMAADRVNEVYSYHVIPRPHDEIEALIANVDRGPGRGNGLPEGVIPPPPPSSEEPDGAPAPLAPEAPVAAAEEAVAFPAGEAMLPVEEVAAAEPEEGEEPAASGRCAAITQAGTRCRNRVMSGSRYCRQHQPRETRTAFAEEA